MVMVAGDTHIMAGDIRPMVGVTHRMVGVTHITDTDLTGQDIIADTGMDIIMAAVDTITQPHITPTVKEGVATSMVSVNQGRVIPGMEPGRLITVNRMMPDLPMEEAAVRVLQLQVPLQGPGQLQKETRPGV